MQAATAELPAGRGCPACTAPADLDDPFCAACGHAFEQPADGEERGASIRCGDCGARIQWDGDVRSFRCPFCTSAIVVELPTDESRKRPEFVIPFAVTAGRAREVFKAWLGRRTWLGPSDLVTRAAAGKLRGVYIPFWTFSARAESDWSARIGEYWYRTETYTVTVTRNGRTRTETRTRRVRETEWWPLAGKFQQFQSEFLVSGSRGLPQELAERIKPFRLEALKRYRPRFLAGWLSEEYSVDEEAARARGLREFERRQTRDVAAFMPGDEHARLNVQTRFSDIHADLVLLPVYLLSYKYRGDVFRFLLNGQTERCHGDRPRSRTRIAIAVLLGIGVAALAVFALLVALGIIGMAAG